RRANTSGDSSARDIASGTLPKLGRDARASPLPFAHFSPEGSKAAYVRDRNRTVEDIQSGSVTPLTSAGSTTIINGTSDWVYEEELFLRDAYRWSQDGRSIA